MAFGIDTYSSHVDLIDWNDFKTWNGAAPAFAGRNFLGGDFVWGHAEATDAGHRRRAKYPDTVNDPNHPENLSILVDRIAPIQARQAARQQMVGRGGYISGAIDATAICSMISSGFATGEFALPSTGLVRVWLDVDPAAPFSADYWAGWASTVSGFERPVRLYGIELPIHLCPFLPCVIAHYSPVAGAPDTLRIDPHILPAVTAAGARHHTTLYALWADAPGAAANSDAPPPVANWGPLLNVDEPEPVIFRFSSGFIDTHGNLQPFALDVARPAANVDPADWMLVAQRWQPNVPSIQNVGFSSTVAATYKKNWAEKLPTHPLPAMPDRHKEKYPTDPWPDVRGGPARGVGRYVREKASKSIDRSEAVRLDAATIFTCWERSHGGATNNSYYTARHGTRDGRAAFKYCGETLKQPPQTTLFFAIDAAPGKAGVIAYVASLKAERDRYNFDHPDRPFQIGVYGCGRTLRWCYEQGFAASFWQAASFGRPESSPHNWPWYHANRWQYQFSGKAHVPPGGWNVVGGFDPDADWGDGGLWHPLDLLERSLEALETLSLEATLRALFPWAWPIVKDL